MRASTWTATGTLILAMAFAAAGWGQIYNSQNISVPQAGAMNAPPAGARNMPQPGAMNMPPIGAVNYVEGQAAINGQPLSASSVGRVMLQKGQTLTTQSGKVEILLTPGVFLRVADNSSVSMVSPSLAPTEVALENGRAMVEVDYIQKANDILIDQNGASTKLLKKGLYEFNANTGQVRIFKGKAEAFVGTRTIKLGQDDQAVLTAAQPRSRSFKMAKYEDSFYDWSGMRSGYIAEANNELAAEYGNYWYGYGYPADWYWDPWLNAWAFPYGWGLGFYGGPFFYGTGFYGGGFYGRGLGYRGFGGRGFARGGFGGFHGGGFHGGGMHAGGFHGGGGHR